MTASDASAILIRDSRDDDVSAIQAIYAHHVLHGTGSFEEVPPAREEMATRRKTVLGLRLPYIVAEAADGTVAGYAYASTFRPRIAYRYTVEDSIYMAPGMQGRGIGRRLLAEIIDRCEARGMRQMIAVIGDSNNTGSIALHARMGFVHSGTMRSTGFKFGRWIDTVIMQRALGPGDASLPE